MNELEQPNRYDDDGLRRAVDALLALRPIAEAACTHLRVRCDASLIAPLGTLARQFGVLNLRFVDEIAEPTLGEEIATQTLAVVESRDAASLKASSAEGENEITLNLLRHHFPLQLISAGDGVPLRIFAGGTRAPTGVIVVGACGMPVELLSRWLPAIASEHFVATWETRALFPPFPDFNNCARDVPSQARDLISVMDAVGMEQAQLVGLCGGAVIALEAAAEFSDRISALSVWHGDYFGSGAGETAHQRDVYELLEIASRSSKEADAIGRLLLNSASVQHVPKNIAPLVLYPYVSGDLLYRYAALNGAIMRYDLRPRLGKVRQMVDVVTSDDDHTAHPDGSRDIARHLGHSHLTVLPHGDHLSLFEAPSRIVSMLREFLGRNAA